MNEPTTTIVGNLTSDPEIRYLASGTAVCNFTVAATPRVKDRDGAWTDGPTWFVRCAVWRDPAEHAAESLSRGTRVLVHGRLRANVYEKDGEKRTSIDMDVEHFGPELRYATAKVMKADRSGGGGRSSAPAVSDPWGDVPPPADEIPF